MKTWCGALILLAYVAGTAVAQTSSFPDRPITLIVTSAPGGVTDVVGRALGDELGKAWGQPVVVENKGGAAHIVGAETVAKAAPDGYTLLVGESGTFTVNPTLYPKDKLPFDTDKDFIPITGLVRINQALLARKALPVANTAELIALARQKPGQLTYGTAGIGSALHMNMELFDSMAGVKLLAVHYRGAAPALNDLIGGSIDVMTVSVASGLPAYQAGQIKMLGIGSEKRLPQMPDMPIVAETAAWLHVRRVVRPVRARRHAAGHRDENRHRDAADLQRPGVSRALSRSADVRIDGGAARRFCRLHQGGARQMGQGDPRGRHKAGVTKDVQRNYSGGVPLSAKTSPAR